MEPSHLVILVVMYYTIAQTLVCYSEQADEGSLNERSEW